MIGDRYGFRQKLALAQPVRGGLQFRDELLVGDRNEFVVSLSLDKLATDLVVIFGDLLDQMLGVAGALIDPLRFLFIGSVQRAHDRRIVLGEFAQIYIA